MTKVYSTIRLEVWYTNVLLRMTPAGYLKGGPDVAGVWIYLTKVTEYTVVLPKYTLKYTNTNTISVKMIK